MDRYAMMAAIANTIPAGESLHVRVTSARGRTLVDHYRVSADGYAWIKRSWNGYGNLRDTYKLMVIGARHESRA